MVKEENSALTTLAILIGLALIYFGFRPILSDYRENRLSLETRKMEIVALEARKAELETLQTKFSKSASALNRLAVALPDDEQYPELLTQISALSAASGTTLSSIQPSRGTSASEEVITTLSLKGSYPSLITFFENLEHNLRPIQVKSLNITRGDESSNLISATIQLGFAKNSSGGSQ